MRPWLLRNPMLIPRVRLPTLRSPGFVLLIAVLSFGVSVGALATAAARGDSLRLALKIPGLPVVVLRDTAIVLARGLGYADLERKIAATPTTPYNIASVAKAMSAVVALRLVELGQLDLDRKLATYDGFAKFCHDSRERGGIFFRDYE